MGLVKSDFDGQYISLRVDENGWEYIETKPCVCAVVYNFETNVFLMVEQNRPPIGRRIREIPAGQIDEGETPTNAIRREILEETGYEVQGNNLSYLGKFPVSPGNSNELMYVFMAEVSSLDKVSDNIGVGDEDIIVSEFFADSVTIADMSVLHLVNFLNTDMKSALALSLAFEQLKLTLDK